MQTTHFRCVRHGDVLSQSGEPCCMFARQVPGVPVEVEWDPNLRNELHATADEAGWRVVELQDTDVFWFAQPHTPVQAPIVVRWAAGTPVRVIMDATIEGGPYSPANFIQDMAWAFDMRLAQEGGVTLLDPGVPAAEVRAAEGVPVATPAYEGSHTLGDLLGWAEGLDPLEER